MTHPHDEHVMDRRAGAVRGLVAASDDSGQVQTIDVQTHDGMLRTAIEVAQPFGHASRAPASGAVVVLHAVGGDEGDMLASPMVAPGTRFGGLAEGDSVVYNYTGDRVHVRHGGTIEVLAAATVTVRVGAVEMVLTATGVVVTGEPTIDGDLTVNGMLSVNGQHGGGVCAIVGDVRITGALGVTGSATIGGDLSVGGTISGSWAGR